MLMMAGPRMTMNIAGMMQKISGKQDLDREFHRLFFDPLDVLGAHLGGLDAQDVGDGDSELLRLDHGVEEDPQLIHVCPFGEGTKRVGASAAELNLFQDAGELLRQRPIRIAGDLRQRCVEGQTGFDGDRQEVDAVGQRLLDLRGPLLRFVDE